MKRAFIILATVLTLVSFQGCNEDPIKPSDPEKKEEEKKDPEKPDEPEEPEEPEDTTGIRTAAEFVTFLKKSNAAFKDEVVISADLDFTGIALSSAPGFGGTLKGQGHKLSNIAMTEPLFISNSGTITELTIDSSCSFTGAPGTQMASLVGTNTGSLTDITNNSKVSVKSDGAVEQSCIIGGITALSSGKLTRCSNGGEVSFSTSVSSKAVSIGGIVGHLSSTAEECTNSGSVKVTVPFISGSSSVGDITAAFISIGGIAGSAWTGFSASGCKNSGNITASSESIEKITSSAERCQGGGIVGTSCGPVSNCDNSGKIEITAITSDRSVLSALSFIWNVGGICGGDYLAPDKASTDITGCTNSGDMTLTFDASRSYTTFAGIVGWPNKEDSSITRATTDCTNSGNITVSGTGKCRVGGIMSGTGNLVRCTNKGNVHVLSAFEESAAGGVCAFHSQNNQLDGCVNEGNVISDVKIRGLALLVGNHGNSKTTCGSGCKVGGLVKQPNPDLSWTGTVVGYWNGTTNAVTLGDSRNPIQITGSIDYNGTTYKVDATNYTQLLCGTANSSANHSIYTSFDGTISSREISGKVTWSGGAAAKGITVSDGFGVDVTDSEGKYSLTVTSDSRYVYISLPEDAKIKKTSTGSPSFFQKITALKETYDFSLEKQEVEKKFRIFAMADPQAHYTARSPQKKADTDRFLAETVPALNAQVAASSLPCYGITLGDITYSENSRNSNPGMSVMLANFGKVNMPVFQTMGNHDYTFYTSSSPLTTDATSSTLHLKVQRAFEDCFGPINYSFNRGDVHFVCMRDIIYDSSTDQSQHGGFSADQYKWLKADLSNVPTTKKIVLCVHIPIVGITSGDNVSAVLSLMSKYKDSEIFSGHTHYKRGVADVGSTGIYEHVHSAVCGQWWWSKIEGDGCPNGYTVYDFDGTAIVDEHFLGVNDKMNTRDYQMRIYKGNLKYGGSYVYFQTQYGDDAVMINIFNGDSRWKSISVYENGVYSGQAVNVSKSSKTYTVSKTGGTVSVPATSSQDWWATGYHIGALGRGLTSTSYYTTNFHMYKYLLKKQSATVSVEATDPYGTVYKCSEIITDGTNYPDYIKIELK